MNYTLLVLIIFNVINGKVYAKNTYTSSPRYDYLATKKESGKLLSPREKAELDVLSTGGSSRHAYLAAKKASGKLLSPREKAELDVLSTGGSSGGVRNLV